MATEPISITTGGSIASGVSGATIFAIISDFIISAFGVSYYALTWAFFGSLFAVLENGKKKTEIKDSRLRTVLYTFLSTLLGASVGSSIYEAVLPDITPKIVLTALCAVAGFSIKAIIMAMSDKIVDTIRGNKGTTQKQEEERK